MKKFIPLLIVITQLGTVALSSADDCKLPPPYVGSKAFERLKTLAGNWTGTDTKGDQTSPVAAHYAVTSNGSVVVETLFPGSPHEMVTVYHDRKGTLAMTHFCALGNRPTMTLTSSSDTQLEFSLDNGGEVDAANEAHMHALTLSLPAADKLVQTWTYFDGGKAAGSTTIELTRTK